MDKVSLKEIKKLRAKTRSPVMDCKRALEESRGDLKKAYLWLKKAGAIKVEKRKDREVGQGIIHAYIHNDAQNGALVKLCCESDFVARNQDFIQLAHEIALQVAAMNPKDVKELLKQEYIRDPARTIEDLLNEAIAQFGENIKIEKFSRLEI